MIGMAYNVVFLHGTVALKYWNWRNKSHLEMWLCKGRNHQSIFSRCLSFAAFTPKFNEQRKWISRNAGVTSTDGNWIVGQKSDVSDVVRHGGATSVSLLTRDWSELTLCVIAYVHRRCVCSRGVRHACRVRFSIPASCQFHPCVLLRRSSSRGGDSLTLSRTLLLGNCAANQEGCE